VKVLKDGIVESDKYVRELTRLYFRRVMDLFRDKFSQQLKFSNCLKTRQKNGKHLRLEKLYDCKVLSQNVDRKALVISSYRLIHTFELVD